MALISPLFDSVPPRLYGGTERVVYNLCCGLKNAGIDVTLFASADSEAPCRVIPITEEAIRLRDPAPLDPHIYNFKMLTSVRNHISEFDIIHNNHDYWMLPLSEQISVPMLTTLHGRLDTPVVADLLSEFNKTHFVSISDSQRTPIPNLPWVRTIYHGIDLSRFTFKPEPGKYLAFLGRIHPEKRPDWAIQIAKLSGYPLKIAAKIEGRASQEYFDACVRPELNTNLIEYVGEISENEKCKFLGDALALVFPVDWPEPFGLVMIEALACGTPVLARPCGSVPEILRDGLTGFVRHDINELANLVPYVGQLSRKSCHEWAVQNFSRERMTEDYIHVYRLLSELPFRHAGAGHVRNNDRRNILHSVKRRFNGNS